MRLNVVKKPWLFKGSYFEQRLLSMQLFTSLKYTALILRRLFARLRGLITQRWHVSDVEGL